MNNISSPSAPVASTATDNAYIDQEDCIICYEKFGSRDVTIVKTHCNHYYHQNCLNEWFNRRDVQTRCCCYCRQPALPLVVVSGDAHQLHDYMQHKALNAVYNGNMRELNLIIERDPDIVFRTFQDFQYNVRVRVTLLMAAAREGHLNIVRSLLDNGADVNAAMPDRSTALTWAAAKGHQTIVDLLLTKNPYVDLITVFRVKTLLFAQKCGCSDELLCMPQSNIPHLLPVCCFISTVELCNLRWSFNAHKNLLLCTALTALDMLSCTNPLR